MLKQIAVVLALTLGAATVLAQDSQRQNCLHNSDETAANRARRQQAIHYAARVNLAEATVFGRNRASGEYRPLAELPNLPSVPAGFNVQFHTDGMSYIISLKDTRDACRYAVFSDQDSFVYEALPSKSEPTLVPLGTR